MEEARKSGELPPEMDNDGNLINPHIPQYMAAAPWYLKQEEGAGLKHLKAQQGVQHASHGNRKDFYKHTKQHGVRGEGWAKFGLVAGARRGGAADTALPGDDGLSRPSRKRRRGNGGNKAGSAGAAISSVGGGASTVSASSLSYDAKRDRYNGYDPQLHFKNLEKFEREQKIRQKIKDEQRAAAAAKAAKAKAGTAKGKHKSEADEAAAAAAASSSGSDTSLGSDDDSSDDDDFDDPNGASSSSLDSDVKLKDGKAVLFGSTQGKTFHKMTQRNLRIRENTAKYLLNLDPNSAHYDPKSRSMRSNPLPQTDAEGEDQAALYAGDNFVRHTGDVSEMARTQMFAWEAYNKGQDAAHLQANPTQVELAKKQFAQRKEKIAAAKKKRLLAKYGGEDHLKAKLPRNVRFGETSQYAEYAPDGRLVKGFEQAAPPSKYAATEDQHTGGHSSVWGSYFDRDELKWGYACCWQTARNAYCVGEAGKAAFKESKAWAKKKKGAADTPSENHANAADRAREQRPGAEGGADGNHSWNRADDFGAGHSTVYGLKKKLDPDKLRREMALEAAKGAQRAEAEDGGNADGGGGAAAAGGGSADPQSRAHWGATDINEEQVEAQRLLKKRKGDVFANVDDVALEGELLPMPGEKSGSNEMLRQTA